MSGLKITQLGNQSLVDSSDLFTFVDVSDTTYSASGTNKKILFSDLLGNIPYIESGDNVSLLNNNVGYLTSHPTITAASSSDNTGRTYIQDILLDSNGHVTGITTATETVVDTNTTYVAGTGVSLGGPSGTTISIGQSVGTGDFVQFDHIILGPEIKYQSRGLTIFSNLHDAATQHGIFLRPKFSDICTAYVGIGSFPATSLSGNVSTLRHYQVSNVDVSGTTSIVSQYGLDIGSLTAGSNNYGIYSQITNGTENWNYFGTGTAPSYFNHDVLIGTKLKPTAGGTGCIIFGNVSEPTIHSTQSVFWSNNGVMYSRDGNNRTRRISRGGIVASSGSGNVSFDLDAGLMRSHTLTGSGFIGVYNFAVGDVIQIKLIQGGIGNNLVSWSGTVNWTDGITPTLSTGVGKGDWFTLICTATGVFDGGMSLYNV